MGMGASSGVHSVKEAGPSGALPLSGAGPQIATGALASEFLLGRTAQFVEGHSSPPAWTSGPHLDQDPRASDTA